MGSWGVGDESEVREQVAGSDPSSPPHHPDLLRFSSLAAEVFLSLNLPTTCCVTLGESLPFSEPHFLSVLQRRGPLCYFKDL